MGYTEHDAAQDLYDQEQAAEEAEKERRAYEQLREKVERLRAAEMEEVERLRAEEFQRAVDGLFPDRTDSDLFEFTWYAAERMNEIDHLKDSAPRGVIARGLATMQNYEALVGRDGDAVRTLLDGITPGPTDPLWGRRGKPANTYSHLLRMRNDGLLEQVSEKVEGGELIHGVRGRPALIAYAVRHGHLPVEALVECWKTDGVGPQKTTNEWALSTEDDSAFRFTTSNEWACFAALQEWDNYIEDRYAEKRPHEVERAFAAAHNVQAVKAFQFLDDEHRVHLIEEVLLQSDVGSNHAVFANIVGQIASKRALEDRVAAMVEYYASGNPCGPDEDGQVDVSWTEKEAKDTVEELICRFVWIVVRRLMDHRMSVKAPEARATTARDAEGLDLGDLLKYLRGHPEVIDFNVRYQTVNAEGKRPDITIEASTREPLPPEDPTVEVNTEHALVQRMTELPLPDGEEPF